MSADGTWHPAGAVPAEAAPDNASEAAMLILNNGVPKSGTTWVQRILETALDPAAPEARWCNGWQNPSVDVERLPDYLDSMGWCGDRPVLVKTHFVHTPTLRGLDRDGVRVVVSWRNLPDAVVSRFYHLLRAGGLRREDREAWCRSEGLAFALRAVAFRLSWWPRPNALMVDYDALVADAPGNVARILDWLGFPVSPEQAARIAADTQETPGDTPRDGMHVRTGGVSTAEQDLPEDVLNELQRLDRVLGEACRALDASASSEAH